MKGHVAYRKFEFRFPAQKEPAWSNKVDRWYQLDAYAFGIAQAYYELKNQWESIPSFILLSSPESSNRTDFSFAQTGGTSPSKFVHTLPNVRGSSLCQVMDWSGPLLCIQNDPFTLLSAIREGVELVAESKNEIWVMGVNRAWMNNDTSSEYCVHWFLIQSSVFRRSEESSEIFEVLKRDFPRKTDDQAIGTDEDFFEWLNLPKEAPKSFYLTKDYELKSVMKGI